MKATASGCRPKIQPRAPRCRCDPAIASQRRLLRGGGQNVLLRVLALAGLAFALWSGAGPGIWGTPACSPLPQQSLACGVVRSHKDQSRLPSVAEMVRPAS